MIALTPGFKWDYVLKEERGLPKEKQTSFKLKALTGAEQLVVVGSDLDKRLAVALVNGLVGWENFKDATGNPVEFKKTDEGKCELGNLDRLAKAGVLLELGGAIIAREVVTEEELKN